MDQEGRCPGFPSDIEKLFLENPVPNQASPPIQPLSAHPTEFPSLNWPNAAKGARLSQRDGFMPKAARWDRRALPGLGVQGRIVHEVSP